MPTHSESRIVSYSAEQLFNLVIDVEKYPDFLPWCLDARISDSSKNALDADMIVGYKVFRETFSSHVHFTRFKEIEINYLKGPMRHLHTKWMFKDINKDQCQIDFYIDFSLKTRLFERLVNQFFHKALITMVNAFELRATELYGAKKRYPKSN
ncbi:MAG: type II toxin-antitoxin system RatA family toxin [Alphaproteobacteria bacterium]|nr:type II toxin-antitoxin system RatA family toxin [Alphaproteobacteria bacterium]